MVTVAVDPRIERTREVVLKAAVEIVGEQGFSGASIEAISQRSGVARSTIYRHWPQRMDLLLEAVGEEVRDVDALITGDLHSDLISISTHLARLLTSEPVGSVIASLILESRRDPAIDELRRRFIEQRRLAAAQVIDGGISRGELPANTDAGALVNDLAAQVFLQTLVLRAPIDRPWVEDLIDQWLKKYGAMVAPEEGDHAN
jgi:AcrR family transcriptional regulator